MRLSPHFENLIESYRAELDDLRDDSEGKNVLDKRLKEKRRELKALLPMIEVCPELVAPVFHQAFQFKGRRTDIEGFLSLAEEGAMPWDELAPTLEIAHWAKPMIATVLAADGGDAFLSTAACLEYLLARGGGRGGDLEGASDGALAGERGRVGDDDADGSDDGVVQFDEDGEPIEAAAEAFDRFSGSDGDGDGSADARDVNEADTDDYLEQQGFDRRKGE